jgi:hypothetical protein
MWKPQIVKDLLDNVEGRNEFRNSFFFYVHIDYCRSLSL